VRGLDDLPIGSRIAAGFLAMAALLWLAAIAGCSGIRDGRARMERLAADLETLERPGAEGPPPQPWEVQVRSLAASQALADLAWEARAGRAAARVESERARMRLIGLAAAGTLFAALAAAALHRSVVRPLRSGIGVLNRMAAGRLDRRMNLRRGDEFGELALAVDTFSGYLGRTLEELDRGAAILTVSAVELHATVEEIQAGLGRMNGAKAGKGLGKASGVGDAEWWARNGEAVGSAEAPASGIPGVGQGAEQATASLEALGMQVRSLAEAVRSAAQANGNRPAEALAEEVARQTQQAGQGIAQINQHLAQVRGTAQAVTRGADRARDAALDLARMADALRAALGRFTG
jgi:methyl-accepting chemotaxis protein